MARHIRTTITMLVLLGILVAGAWYGWQGLQRGDASAPTGANRTATPAPSPTCEPATTRTVRPAQIQVSVYNAGAPSGTAGEVFEALTDVGFRPGQLGNAPDDIAIDRPGILIWGPEDSAEARLVRKQFRRARMLARTDLLGPGVNVLIVGPFEGLRDQAPRRLRVRTGDRGCPARDEASG